MTTPDNPAYTNRPVILVHLAIEPRTHGLTRMAWCAPYTIVEESDPSAYPKIPRVLCPACAQGAISSADFR